jgi:hypothetical protein
VNANLDHDNKLEKNKKYVGRLMGKVIPCSVALGGIPGFSSRSDQQGSAQFLVLGRQIIRTEILTPSKSERFFAAIIRLHPIRRLI